MFTKPSLDELLDGVSKNAEDVLLPALEGTPAAGRITGLLMVLDRLAAEWNDTAAHLAEDNIDIEQTLRGIAAATRTPSATHGGPLEGLSDVIGGPAVDGRHDHDAPWRSAAELAERNRDLKAALVQAMDALDLPAAPGASPAVRQADLEVRELLLRMLQRERTANPTMPPRQDPLSRGGPSLDAAEGARMTSALEHFLRREMPEAADISVTDLRPLAGGASREAFTFDVRWSSDAGPASEHCVLLRQPVSSVLESDDSEAEITGSRRLPNVEFKMIQLMEEAGIAVPHMLWVEPTGATLERPFSVARWIEGEADLTKLAGSANLEQILQDYIEILARIHTLDPTAVGVDFLGAPTPDTAALEQVDLFDRGFQRQRLEEIPALSYLVRWLRKHQPVASRVSVIHGDFRLGNFMWDDTGIVAMLDWEQCHLGDPLEELAFMYWPLWTLEPLVPLEEMIGRYEEASGIPVDLEALAWYRMFIELKMSVVLLTGIRSFYATPERQLMYGATLGFEMLRECQVRAVEELLHDGPTVDFRWSQVTQGVSV